eukprot:6438271-Karenia_brevis.AAC.1
MTYLDGGLIGDFEEASSHVLAKLETLRKRCKACPFIARVRQAQNQVWLHVKKGFSEAYGEM